MIDLNKLATKINADRKKFYFKVDRNGQVREHHAANQKMLDEWVEKALRHNHTILQIGA